MQQACQGWTKLTLDALLYPWNTLLLFRFESQHCFIANLKIRILLPSRKNTQQEAQKNIFRVAGWRHTNVGFAEVSAASPATSKQTCRMHRYTLSMSLGAKFVA